MRKKRKNVNLSVGRGEKSKTALVRVKGLSIPPIEVDEIILVLIGPGTA